VLSQGDAHDLGSALSVRSGYAKAIEQLGNDNLDVRLGGIYSLEQIATDSPLDRDQATVVEVLRAFVRVHSDPPVDVQAAVTVLGRLTPREGVSRGDLSGANLTKAILDGADLTNASLYGANLAKAEALIQEQLNVGRGDSRTLIPATRVARTTGRIGIMD
jgi:hypothetical protein